MNSRELFHSDAAYRLLALWHRRSWRTKLRAIDEAERRMRGAGFLVFKQRVGTPVHDWMRR
jgi:hypothetical protein